MMLRYDLRGAYERGHEDHPQIVMKNLGFKVVKSEGVPIADCVFFEVEENDIQLPEFLDKSEFEFTL